MGLITTDNSYWMRCTHQHASIIKRRKDKHPWSNAADSDTSLPFLNTCCWMTASNLGWHSRQHIHNPLGACSDPHTGFICINKSIQTNVLAQNSSTAAYRCWCVTQAKHPSGRLTCFWAEHDHPSAEDFYKPNNLIWINKSCFEAFSGVDMQRRTPTPTVTSTQGPQNNYKQRFTSIERWPLWYWCSRPL